VNILIVWQSAYPWEVRIEKFAEVFRDRQHAVTVLCRHRGEASGDEVLSSGIRVIRVGIGTPRALGAPVSVNPVWFMALRSTIRSVKPDLIIVRDLPLAELVGHVARSRGIPVVMDMAEHYPGALRSWKKYRANPFLNVLIHRLRLPDAMEKRAVGLMDGVITVCEEQIDRLANVYGYPRSKMRVVNNSPRRTWFAGARKGVSDTPRIFGHHGHMTPERGLDVLLEAFALVAHQAPNVELHLAGAGESASEVRGGVARLGLGDKVKNFGRFDHADLDRLYGAIDIGVLPYPPNELINHTLSNKLFDYMACGKPIITSGAAPMKRLMIETGAGMFFEPWTAEALARVMSEALALDLGPLSERGMKAFHEKYHWEADVVNLLAFVETIRRVR